MSQDDIEYVLELLKDATESQDWDLIEEAQQYLEDFLANRKPTEYPDEE